jgi:hypothetical protein
MSALGKSKSRRRARNLGDARRSEEYIQHRKHHDTSSERTPERLIVQESWVGIKPMGREEEAT